MRQALEAIALLLYGSVLILIDDGFFKQPEPWSYD